MTPTEPRNPALRRFLQSVVRVESATGVAFLNHDVRLIVTAWHAVKDRAQTVRVSHGSITYATPVLQHDEDTDLAILADDTRLLAVPLPLLELDSPVAVGDEVHIAGFPGGWPGDLPLLSSGTVAGFQGEFWMNVDATWGHSGGPVCVLQGGEPKLAGVVLGRAGQLRHDLDQLVLQLTNSAKRLGEAAAQGGGGFAVGTSMGPVTFGGTANLTGNALVALAQFSATHFRTGFTRAASVSDVRRLL